MGGSGRWVAAAQSFWAVSREGSAAGLWVLAAVHRDGSGLPRDRRARSGGDGLQGLVAERAQEVVAAFQEFARDRDAGAVAADPLGELFVVRTVGAARSTRGLRSFIERPAQRGRSLAGEMPGRAALVGLLDGDIQAGVPDRVAGVLEPAGVTELSNDRDWRSTRRSGRSP